MKSRTVTVNLKASIPAGLGSAIRQWSALMQAEIQLAAVSGSELFEQLQPELSRRADWFYQRGATAISSHELATRSLIADVAAGRVIGPLQ